VISTSELDKAVDGTVQIINYGIEKEVAHTSMILLHVVYGLKQEISKSKESIAEKIFGRPTNDTF
jgi:hypothetical protein